MPIANHLWQSTLFALGAGLLTIILKQNRAQVRYRIWLAASIKFLLPFALLLSLGRQFEWREVRIAAVPLVEAAQQISEPFAMTSVTAQHSFDWSTLILAMWLIGFLTVATRWWMRWQKIRVVLRDATSRAKLSGHGDSHRILFSGSCMEPSVVGVIRPVLLLPESIATTLTHEQLRSVLAHEFCHIRRRDNLAAAIHMVVEAIFWFHPLVWWIGARLIEEREQACDEEVLSQGNKREVYAASILKVCRSYVESPLACSSGVTGADLKKRITAIMSGRALHDVSVSRKLLLTAAGIFAIAAPLVVGVASSQTPADRLRFDVASIRPTKTDSQKSGLEILPGGGLRMGGVTIKSLIAFAYNVRETQISGGPNWINSETFNVLAKAESTDPADNPRTVVAPGTAAWNRVCQRLQSLLEERCGLKIHKNTKDIGGYALVIAKGGPKLKESESQGNPSTMRSFGAINSRRGTVTMLAAVLTGFLGRPVEDRTGLTGAYDYKLEYTQDPGPAGKGAPGEAEPALANLSGPSVFTAIQEQLGLKLESAKVKTETIVIDEVARPSDN